MSSLHRPIPAALLLLAAGHVSAQEPETGVTSEVFRRFADRVVKIEVAETGSAAKAAVGSGFYASPDGHVVTNYHVVAEVLLDPARYAAELIEEGGARRPVTVAAVDVVHDLAVLETGHRPAGHLTLAAADLPQGVRLFALGHPADLGLSIVEGTYNGPLRHALYERLHFTGSLNPGMSGGPAITRAGRVVGINVATAGNQLSFLVPAARALELLEGARQPGYSPPQDFLTLVGRQIHEHQDRYLRELFRDSVPTVVIGEYRLPTRPAPFFNCWADLLTDPGDPYEIREHTCSTDDDLFISGDHSSGILEFTHEFLSSASLNRWRFYALYSAEFASAYGSLEGSESDVTVFRCRTRSVRSGDLKFRGSFCVRRFRRFQGLYDVVFKVAVLGGRRSGLVSTLVLSGVSFENAQRVTRRYLESITWAGR
jgi:S1-C subfamily serine protease